MTNSDPSSKKSILLIEDEVALAEILRDYLIDANMDVSLIFNGLQAVEPALSGKHDLVILDLMLPGKNGLDICREIRQSSTIPIIFVTAKAEEIDRLLGLELGADDYVCKPFSPRELIARIKAILRRLDYENTTVTNKENNLILDKERWLVTLDGLQIDLTRREFQLLDILYTRQGRVFSRSQLPDLAFPDDSEIFDRTIDSHIKNIRGKFKDACNWDPIRSVYGVGYSYGE